MANKWMVAIPKDVADILSDEEYEQLMRMVAKLQEKDVQLRINYRILSQAGGNRESQ